MYELCVLATAVVAVGAALGYAKLTWEKKIDPAPVTWILMVLTMTLSLAMYLSSPDSHIKAAPTPYPPWTKNIGVAAGAINVSIILAAVVATRWFKGGPRKPARPVQVACLVGGSLIVVWWGMTDNDWQAYCLVQAITLIAYVATIAKLLKEKEVSEPMWFWATMLGANICALYPAWVSGDKYAWLFLGRAMPSTLLVVFLIAKFQARTRRAQSAVA